jgi:hypothetical protein
VTFALSAVLDKADSLLKGEATRFIAYGGAVLLVGLVAGLNALGVTRFGAGISLTDALVGTTAAIGTLVGFVESIRHFVYSQNTVQAIAVQAAITGDATVPPPPASDVVAPPHDADTP